MTPTKKIIIFIYKFFFSFYPNNIPKTKSINNTRTVILKIFIWFLFSLGIES